MAKQVIRKPRARRAPARRRPASAPPPATASPPSPEPPEIPAFTPAPLRRRHDGWTPERQGAFLHALAETASVTDACAAVGMSPKSAYVLRARPDAISFRNAWDAALDYAVRRLADAALSRALNGVAVPVFFQGEQIGERRYYDERLTMFMLRYRDPVTYGKWRDRHEIVGHVEHAAAAFHDLARKAEEDAAAPPEDAARLYRERVIDIARAMAKAMDEDPDDLVQQRLREHEVEQMRRTDAEAEEDEEDGDEGAEDGEDREEDEQREPAEAPHEQAAETADLPLLPPPEPREGGAEEGDVA